MPLIQLANDEWVFPDDDAAAENEFDEILESFHAGDLVAAERLLKQFTSRNPTHIDAWQHLALVLERTERATEAFLCCREAVRLGTESFPNEFSWITSKLMWGFLENRPFLRAYHNLGLWFQRRGQIDAAIEVFVRLLSTSPQDNLGVRYLLPELWLEKGDLLSVVRHCKQCDDDVFPEITYTYPLALILLNEIEKARPMLTAAKRRLPLVAKELLKKRHSQPSTAMPGHITLGGADQAYEYWVRFGKYWHKNAPAMQLLAEKL